MPKVHIYDSNSYPNRFVPYFEWESYCPTLGKRNYAGWYEGVYFAPKEDGPLFLAEAKIGDQKITMPLDDFVAMGFLRKD